MIQKQKYYKGENLHDLTKVFLFLTTDSKYVKPKIGHSSTFSSYLL